jgi:hypothetical protein
VETDRSWLRTSNQQLNGLRKRPTKGETIMKTRINILYTLPCFILLLFVCGTASAQIEPQFTVALGGGSGEPGVLKSLAASRAANSAYSFEGWQKLPGGARDIGVGANGSVWVIGTNSTHGGFGIYHWNGSNWDAVAGGGVRIAVGPHGNPWVVNANQNIYEYTEGDFQLRPGSARDIGIGADGSVWVIGTNSVHGGFGIYRWNGDNWDAVAGGGVRIAVGPHGNPWVVNSSQKIYEYTEGDFQLRPGSARDIGVGADGSVWVIGTNSMNGGLGIHHWNGDSWDAIDGGGVDISVGPRGRPWVVNSTQEIFRRN